MTSPIFQCIPVTTSHEYNDFLVQNRAGDWIWGVQGQTSDPSQPGYANPADPLHVVWVINNLTQRTSVVVQMDTRYVKNHDEGSWIVNSLLGRANQLRAPNGDVWLVAAKNHIMKWSGDLETVVQLPQVQDPALGSPLPNNNPVKKTPDDNTQYLHFFNRTGTKLYTGTQSNFKPALIETDTTTGVSTVLCHTRFTTAHSLPNYPHSGAFDDPWMYEAVGKDPWDLIATHVVTKEQRLLATRPATGNIAIAIKAGVAPFVKMDTNLGHPDNSHTEFWLIDGAIAFVHLNNQTSYPFPVRECTPYSNPVVNPPEIDDTPGFGLVRWRMTPGVGPWQSMAFPVPFGAPVANESLLSLPNGDALGNAENYSGFWWYHYATKTVTWFGSMSGIVSRAKTIFINGIVWICGYPNAELWAVDLSQPWDEATGNPVQHANFHGSGVKYATALDYSPSRQRIYMTGWREREGIGAGIEWYSIPNAQYGGGTYAGLETVKPNDGVVLDTIGRFVLSVEAYPQQVPPLPNDGKLVVFDLDHNRLPDQYILSNMRSAGQLFKTADPNVIVGLVHDTGQEMLYQQNISTGTTILIQMIGMTVGASWQHQTGGPAYAVIGGQLCRLNLETLTWTFVDDAVQFATCDAFVISDQNEALLYTGPIFDVIALE